MKKQLIIFVIASIFIGYNVYSQTSSMVEYTYDASGNRLTRTYSLGRIVAPKDSLAMKGITNTEHDFKLFPNPTTGLLNLTISNLKSESKGKIEICDLNGVLIFSQNNVLSQNTIDLTKATNGMYIMRISIDGKRSDWKIIKSN